MLNVYISGVKYEPAYYRPVLSEEQWAILEKVENRMYRDNHGMNGYSHVMPREESYDAASLWDTAYMSIDATNPEFNEIYKQHQAARRVAMCFMLVNFGPEMLLV